MFIAELFTIVMTWKRPKCLSTDKWKKDVACECVLSHFSCVWLFAILWTVACQAPLFMEFSKQEHWSWLPFIPFSRGSSWYRDWTWVSWISGRFITLWAARKFPSITIWPSNCTSRYISKRTENWYSKNFYASTRSNTIHKSQKMKTTQCPSTDEWINKI